MIPENELNVQPNDMLGAFSRGPELPVGSVTGFGPSVPPPADFDDLFDHKTAVTSSLANLKSIDLNDMLQMLDMMRNTTLDKDVALIRNLRAAGFVIHTNPWLPEGKKVVTLPASFDRAIEELERRDDAKRELIDHHVRYVPRAKMVIPND